MIRTTVLCAAVLVLAGCLRPGASVERVSETDIDPDATPTLEAVAVPQAEGAGILSELFGEANPEASEDNATAEAVDVPDEDEVQPARRGLARLLPFGRGSDATKEQSDAAQPEAVAVAVDEAEPTTDEQAEPEVSAADVVDETPELADDNADRPRGLFARLRVGAAADAAAPEAQVTQVAAVVTPGLSVPEVAEAEPEETRVAARRTTLLGALRRGGGPTEPGPGQDSIAFGTKLPYGALATICGVQPALMGEQVASYPERSPRYRIYDSAPGTLALRTHYITGFKDGCARQFTAALALFGAPGGHEATRYKSSHRHIDMTRTDREYEALRARSCQAPVGSTCPERRFSRFEKSTVFVSVYERFGTNPRWADLLIHDGRVVAKDLKGD